MYNYYHHCRSFNNACLSHPFFGPFVNPPTSAGGNCAQEERFKYDVTIKSVDDFIDFLKVHQYEGDLTHNYKPTMNSLIPSHITITHDTAESSSDIELVSINLDDLYEMVTIRESGAIFSNELIYTLEITDDDFNDAWYWLFRIRMSETGHVSILHCAGI